MLEIHQTVRNLEAWIETSHPFFSVITAYLRQSNMDTDNDNDNNNTH